MFERAFMETFRSLETRPGRWPAYVACPVIEALPALPIDEGLMPPPFCRA
jgi:hypothetical protein